MSRILTQLKSFKGHSQLGRKSRWVIRIAILLCPAILIQVSIRKLEWKYVLVVVSDL